MKVEFLTVAEQEFLEAVAYYNRQSEGLGFEFAAEVQQTLGRIIRYPAAWAKLSARTRRCRTKRFPYGLVYHVHGDVVLIIAVMHLHRRPISWERRLRSSRPPASSS